jgi:hypothetical protein
MVLATIFPMRDGQLLSIGFNHDAKATETNKYRPFFILQNCSWSVTPGVSQWLFFQQCQNVVACLVQ